MRGMGAAFETKEEPFAWTHPNSSKLIQTHPILPHSVPNKKSILRSICVRNFIPYLIQTIELIFIYFEFIWFWI